MSSHRGLTFHIIIATLLVVLTSCRQTRTPDILQLPEVHVFTDSIIPWENRINCKVALVSGVDSILYQGTVKYRGGISSKYYKHSYSLKLSESHAFCDLPENRSWILNASYIDKTFMRHKLCFDLFNRMGECDIAPKCAYAMVRENGKSQGLYVVMQRLNKGVLKIDAQDSGSVIFKEPKLFYPDLERSKRTSAKENIHEQTYPDFDKECRDGIITEFQNFILKSSDKEFYAHIGEWIDLQNLTDWHLLLLFTNNGDGVLKNFYMYKKNAQTPFRIAIWDYDHSFGRDGDNEKNMLKHPADIQRNILINRMMKSPDYVESLKSRYAELRKSGLFTYNNIEQMMRENDKFVRLGLEENTRLWPYDSPNYFDSANYEEEYALILEFVKLNLARLDKIMQYHL